MIRARRLALRRLALRRLALPAAAALLAGAATLGPQLDRPQRLTDVLVVIDITRSMNVRDMEGRSRLDDARDRLGDWIASRPCGSRIGLAVFTERRSLTLFEPVEICRDFATLSGALAALDWRMAWDGDSMIQRGLDHALRRAAGMDAALVFVTDGHEAPPLPWSGPAPFTGDSPGGIILGVGGDRPAPIPLFDDLGREVGFYAKTDVQHAPARLGAPPPDAADRPGYHPRNNPYGESDLEGSEHMSALRLDYLQGLAPERGLTALRLSDGPAAIDAALARATPGRVARTSQSLSPPLAALALALLLAAWAVALPRISPTRKDI